MVDGTKPRRSRYATKVCLVELRVNTQEDKAQVIHTERKQSGRDREVNLLEDKRSKTCGMTQPQPSKREEVRG